MKKNSVIVKRESKKDETVKAKISTVKDEEQINRIMFESVNKGIYDLDFCISVCKRILNACKTIPLNELAFTLKTSLESFISYLETQKCGVDKDPYQDMFCTNCGQKERVFKGDVDTWKKCKKCQPKKLF